MTRAYKASLPFVLFVILVRFTGASAADRLTMSATNPTALELDQLVARVGELDSGREIVVHCHHGQRSAAVVQWLRRQGIPAVNLSGGIDGWAVEVDPSLGRY